MAKHIILKSIPAPNLISFKDWTISGNP
ncbi:UNVERIFIED_CONTAM: hypothetical protein GTU68_050215 [Idotea baltica]|nr:hypothetical protein [Idotea baltica]